MELFGDIERHIMLPLASNIQVRRYKMGEYVVRAGEMPEGLVIIREGQSQVVAEKLGMRRREGESGYQRVKGKKGNV